LINKAMGGSRYTGTQSIVLQDDSSSNRRLGSNSSFERRLGKNKNKKKDKKKDDKTTKTQPTENVYFVSLKITAFGGGLYHQGRIGFAMRGKNGAYAQVDGYNAWGCGLGHVLVNVQAYNRAKKEVGHWCWNDQGADGVDWQYATWFGTNAGPFDDVQDTVPKSAAGFTQDQRGGPSDIVSRGSQGYLGVLSNPMSTSTNQQKIGLAQLPCKQTTAGRKEGKKCVNAVRWLDSFSQGGKGASIPKLVRLGGEESDRFLLGYAEFEPVKEVPGTYNVKKDFFPSKFFVVEVNSQGNLLNERMELVNTGWSEHTEWTVIPDTGCVAWPHAWAEAQGVKGPYGSWQQGSDSDTLYTQSVHVTTYCPK